MFDFIFDILFFIFREIFFISFISGIIGCGGDDLYTELWKACAGPLVEVPRAGEKVFYFPQGHMEQVSFCIAFLYFFVFQSEAFVFGYFLFSGEINW